MAEKKNQFGGPAFPSPAFVDPETLATVCQPVEGMSLQTYAAIHLCVPMSEHPIVNEMINKARLDKFAAAALSGMTQGVAGLLDGEFTAYAKGSCNAAIVVRANVIAEYLIKAMEDSHE